MLEKIRFKGFDLEGSSLSILEDDNSEGGKYSLTFTGHKVIPQKDDDGNWLFIEVKPCVTGYPRDKKVDEETKESVEDDDALFRAEASLSLTFECELEDEVSEEFYNENSWFFENYVYICTKIVIENMFKNTVLETVTLPWSPRNVKK